MAKETIVLKHIPDNLLDILIDEVKDHLKSKGVKIIDSEDTTPKGEIDKEIEEWARKKGENNQ